MPYALLAALLLAAPACAQSGKPSAEPDPRARRADSVITSAPAGSDGSRDTTVSVRSVALRIGETPVEVRITERPCTGACWSAVNVHDDENTAVEAAVAVIARQGGRLIELRHTGTRNLAFTVGGAAYTVDPNRIFTDAGRARTLTSLSRDTPAARAATAAFAEALLDVVGTPDVVVALHNNTEDNYSAHSYAPGGSDAGEAAAVRLAPGADPDDFVFVTTRPVFDAVAADAVTAILQNNDTPTDDGSLSVWAAQNGRPYLNIEAQHGHLDENTRLVGHLPAWTTAGRP
ncbi:MAG TPA: hypothetical protein VF594_00225 [Rubricoccaceae bacterium]|jgi:hypothetical protein